MNINHCVIGGNLTRDPESRTFEGGSVCNFSIANNRTFTKKNGEKENQVTFLDCVAWNRTGEIIQQHLTKGRPVLLEGRLELQSWTSAEGEKRQKIRLVVERFHFVSSGERNGDNNSTSPTGEPEPTGQPEDDIPF